MKNILFLCTGNSCRSQMAEGWARHYLSDRVRSYSAGVAVHGVNPVAIQVMAEKGVDISRQTSKHVDDLREIAFDFIITVCGNAYDHCPVWLREGKVIHKPFDDPPQLAKAAVSKEEALLPYRRVRDEIETFVQSLPHSLAI